MVLIYDTKGEGNFNTGRAKRILKELVQNEDFIADFAPKNINKKNLRKNRIRIFKFSEAKGADEMFTLRGNKKYICLNSSFLNKSYWGSFEYLVHGFAHSFCYLKDPVLEEMFCEWVAFSVLKEVLSKKSLFYQRFILSSVMRLSDPEYRMLYRVADKLEKRNPGILMRLNNKAYRAEITESHEKKIVNTAFKGRKLKVEKHNFDFFKPELEKGFRKI